MRDLENILKTLGLRVPMRSIQALLEHAQSAHLGPMQMLEKLATLEREHRDSVNLTRRQREATLGTFKLLDQFDWNHPTAINRPLYEQLHSLEFIRRGENLLLRGGCGLGKTTLAQNLGHQALLHGYAVRFTTLANMLADLLRQESLPALERRMRRFSRPNLLIIDELGTISADARAADILYNIISKRHLCVSTIITTNLPFKQWDQVFPSASSLVSLVDRFGEKCHVLDIDGPSWRDKMGQSFRGKPKLKHLRE